MFFPIGANASEFMSPSFPAKAIDPLLQTWADAGINTLRICLDDFASLEAWDEYENQDGTLKKAAVDRLETLLQAAQKHNMASVISFFDLQRMALHWDTHAYNRKNNGPCANLADFFIKPVMLGRATKRIRQIVNIANDYPILAYELARGINIWERVRNTKADTPKRVEFWAFRIAETLHRADRDNHLIALNYVPNTLPITLMRAPYIHINFLSVQSKNPIVAAKSTAQFIQVARDYKKPVFIAEINWSGDGAGRAELIRNVFWASVASCSGSFLTPGSMLEKAQISSEDLLLAKTLKPFIKYIDLNG
ncbi:hypothetical protein GF373_04775, partial [bacterium]|nr:hypothetical protein [bacterium]